MCSTVINVIAEEDKLELEKSKELCKMCSDCAGCPNPIRKDFSGSTICKNFTSYQNTLVNIYSNHWVKRNKKS